MVRGVVQGVFFRDRCAREARARHVSGWIRNRGDGSVEAWFEGGTEAVQAMVAWCRHGPPHAEVTGVDAETVSPTGLESFRIQ